MQLPIHGYGIRNSTSPWLLRKTSDEAGRRSIVPAGMTMSSV
jgi:hypothetical protein